MKGAVVLACPDAERASELVADIVAASVSAAIAERGKALVALFGGRTPWSAYRRLGQSEVDWSAVTIIQVDEREVTRDHPDRNLGGIVDAFGSPAAQSVVALDGEPDEASERYGKLIETHGAIDVVVLGIGADGHTASLIPDDPVLDCSDTVGRSGVYQGNTRLTLTYSVLNAARLRLVLAHGESKSEALRSAREGHGPAGAIVGDSTMVVTTVATMYATGD